MSIMDYKVYVIMSIYKIIRGVPSIFKKIRNKVFKNSSVSEGLLFIPSISVIRFFLNLSIAVLSGLTFTNALFNVFL